jgi:protein translocase SecG subunit
MEWRRGGCAAKESQHTGMNAIHILLQIIQVIVGITLVVIVTSQTDKDPGMGGAFGGGGEGGGGSKYSGGYEEKLDDLAKNLSFAFLIISVLVAFIGHRFL